MIYEINLFQIYVFNIILPEKNSVFNDFLSNQVRFVPAQASKRCWNAILFAGKYDIQTKLVTFHAKSYQCYFISLFSIFRSVPLLRLSIPLGLMINAVTERNEIFKKMIITSCLDRLSQ